MLEKTNAKYSRPPFVRKIPFYSELVFTFFPILVSYTHKVFSTSLVLKFGIVGALFSLTLSDTYCQSLDRTDTEIPVFFHTFP